jgi:hypothetical protein
MYTADELGGSRLYTLIINAMYVDKLCAFPPDTEVQDSTLVTLPQEITIDVDPVWTVPKLLLIMPAQMQYLSAPSLLFKG